jgi:hypothetical protein|tara:strand:+ start:891 stop:1100 length:210 start_codon:yes stop_codon:yes gene_type:complete
MKSVLKHVLVDHYDPACVVAFQMGRNDAWLSRVARGIVEPTDTEKRKLSTILGHTVRELFSEKPVEGSL